MKLPINFLAFLGKDLFSSVQLRTTMQGLKIEREAKSGQGDLLISYKSKTFRATNKKTTFKQFFEI